MHRMSSIAVYSSGLIGGDFVSVMFTEGLDRTQSTGSFIFTHLKRHTGVRFFIFSTNSNMFPCNTAFHHSKDHTTAHAARHPGNTHVTETLQKTWTNTLNCYYMQNICRNLLLCLITLCISFAPSAHSPRISLNFFTSLSVYTTL